MTTTYPFESEEDGMYYFWLGDALHGPYDEYTDAHTRLTHMTEAMRGKEKSPSQEG